MQDFLCKFELVRGVDPFSANDGTVKFYNFVHAAGRVIGARRILDFGAGRGASGMTRFVRSATCRP